MYLRNNTGKWASIKRIAPTIIESTIGDCVIPECAIGVITIDKIIRKDYDDFDDIVSCIVIDHNDKIEEYFGVVLFEPVNPKKITAEVDGFLDINSVHSLVHPKIAIENKDYLFFANRYNIRD